MPTYGYECTACKHQFEVFQRITDEPVKVCEKCGKPVNRMIYPVGIVFKGSGFYVNDNHSPNPGVGGSTYGQSDTATKPATENKPELAKAPASPATAPAPATSSK